jgi:hypothetical protein
MSDLIFPPTVQPLPFDVQKIMVMITKDEDEDGDEDDGDKNGIHQHVR